MDIPILHPQVYDILLKLLRWGLMNRPQVTTLGMLANVRRMFRSYFEEGSSDETYGSIPTEDTYPQDLHQ